MKANIETTLNPSQFQKNLEDKLPWQAPQLDCQVLASVTEDDDFMPNGELYS